MNEHEITKHMSEFDSDLGMDELLLKIPIDSMVAFNEKNVGEKLKENIVELTKYQQKYILEEARYLELQDLLERTCAEQFEWYKFEHERALENDEIQSYYLPKDPKVIKIKRMLYKQRLLRNFYKLCVDAFQQQSMRMHDFIKILKITD